MADAHQERARRGGARGLLLLALLAGAALVLALVFALGRGDGGRAAEAPQAPSGAEGAAPALAVDGAGGAERVAAGAPPAAEGGGFSIHPGVRLPGPGRLAGRVVDRATGAGVEGARVELCAMPPTGKDMLARIYRSAKFDASWLKRLEPAATVATGPDGAFELGGVRVGTYFLEARGPHHVPEEAVLARVDSEGAGGPVTVHVRPGGRVGGVVRAPGGAPIPGARVILYQGHTHFLTAARSGDFRMLEATTDRAGEFLIAGVPPGEGFELSGIAPGYAISHTSPFAVEAGADARVELSLRKGGTVRGRVLLRSEDGEQLEPVAGAHVGALPRGLRDLGLAAEVLSSTHAVTDERGEYALANVPPGEIDVGAVKGGLQPAKSPPVMAADGVVAEAEPVVMEGGPMVTVHVHDDLGAPLAGVNTSWFVTDFDTLQFEPSFTPLMLQAVEGFEYPKSDAQGLVRAGPFPGSPPHKLFCWLAGHGFAEVEWNPARDGEDIDVVLARGGSAEGIVMDLERAEPVKRFEIRSDRRLEPDDQAPGALNPFSGGLWVEDENGRFRLDGLGTWDAPVVFSAPGYLPETVPITVKAGETTRGLIVKLRRGGTVRGRILDSNGDPVPGAQVAAMDERGRPVAGRLRTPRGSVSSPREAMGQEVAMVSMELFSGLGVIGAGFVVSADDGSYELTGLPEGTLAIHASHRDYADAKTALFGLAAGDPHEGVDLVLSAGGGIYGTVHDRFGAPVSGALILAVSTELMANTEPSARWVRQAGTGADGAYRIEHLEPGGYFLSCSRGDEGLNLASFLGTMNFDLVSVPPDAQVRYDLTDSSAAAVRVYGTLSADGELVQGGGLFAFGFESENVLGLDVKVASVNRDGTYAFAGLAPGAYTFTYQGPGPDVPMEVEIPDAPEYRLDLSLPQGGVAGRVLDAQTEQPVRGAEIVLARDEATSAPGMVGALIQREGRASHARTDRDGRFEFKRLQAGSYVLQVGPPRWGDDRGRYAPAEPQTIEVREGASARGIEVRLAPALELRGRVVDGTGAPVAGARVLAFPHDERSLRPASARSGDDGVFALRGLAQGSYDVTASAEDHAGSEVVEAQVGPEAAPELVLELRAGVEVAVLVRDSAGAPVQGATGRLIPLTKAGGAAAPSLDSTLQGIFSGAGLSGPDGRLDLGRNAPGSYRLEVGRGTLSVVEEPVVLKEGEAALLEVELH